MGCSDFSIRKNRPTAPQATACSVESPFLICIQRAREDAKGSEKPSCARSLRWYRQTHGTELGMAGRVHLGRDMKKQQVPYENEAQDPHLGGEKAGRTLKPNDHTMDKHTGKKNELQDSQMMAQT